MVDVQHNIWENSKHGEGPCQGCPKAGSEYNHPGFFDYDADILVVEEAPSYSHFDFSEYDRSRDYDWYEQFYEDKHLDTILSWDPVTLFLRPVFEPDPPGLDEKELTDEIYVTSSVKCPISNREFDEPFSSCRAYLEREIDEIDPDIVITAGGVATEGTAEVLGISPRRASNVSISKPEWWGLSKFKTEPPMIHVPHWGYYENHNQLTDEEWEACIEAVREGLLDTIYTDRSA